MAPLSDLGFWLFVALVSALVSVVVVELYRRRVPRCPQCGARHRFGPAHGPERERIP